MSSYTVMPNLGCPEQLDGGGSCNTITTSFSRTPDTFIDTMVSSRVDTYLTRLIALLDGNPTIYYDQTFALPFGDLAAKGASSPPRMRSNPNLPAR